MMAQFARSAKYEDSPWVRARRVEGWYGIQLRKIARHVGDIVRAWAPGDPSVLSRVTRALEDYARILGPWAEETARRMLNDVAKRDEAAWVKLSKAMSRELRREILTAPTGERMRQLMDEQVGLITSIPLDAAQRVHKLTLEGQVSGERFSEIVPMILGTSDVSVSRANLIARTETARASTALTQARAEHVGSEGYVWRTARDRDVRKLHKKLEGTYHRWDDPPVAGEAGERAHPGAIYNCRCYPEPVVPDVVA